MEEFQIVLSSPIQQPVDPLLPLPISWKERSAQDQQLFRVLSHSSVRFREPEIRLLKENDLTWENWEDLPSRMDSFGQEPFFYWALHDPVL